MALLLNLTLVLLLIGAAGTGGYLLARAHFTATIANRVLAYQSRLARAQRDAKQAQKDCGRLTAEIAQLSSDLDRARERVHRYEVTLFEGYPEQAAETEASLDAPVQTEVETTVDAAADSLNDQQLQQRADAYVQRVGGYAEFGNFDEQDLQKSLDVHRRGVELMTREIA